MAKKLKWEVECLGGYELLRDGPKTEIFYSHDEMLEHIDEDLGIFYNTSKDELNDLKMKFMIDKEVFDYIEKWYKFTHNDGGGWATIDCNKLDGLLDTFVDWDFSTKENNRDFEL